MLGPVGVCVIDFSFFFSFLNLAASLCILESNLYILKLNPSLSLGSKM